jgi:hypothetical protein
VGGKPVLHRPAFVLTLISPTGYVKITPHVLFGNAFKKPGLKLFYIKIITQTVVCLNSALNVSISACFFSLIHKKLYLHFSKIDQDKYINHLGIKSVGFILIDMYGIALF